MRYLNLLLLFSISVLTNSYAQNNKQLPESLSMETLSGQKVNLKDYVSESKQVTVVNFWATWCKPCKEELDNINADYLDDWKEKYDLKFVAVSMDNSRTKPKVKGVVDTKGWEYEILCNPDNSAYQALGFNSCPYTLLLDANGNIVYQHTGYKPGDEEELEKEIAKAKATGNNKEDQTSKEDTEAAKKAREEAKIALQKGIVQDLEQLINNKVLYYQNYIKGTEKEEAFNKELDKLREQAKATIQAMGETDTKKAVVLPVDETFTPVKEERGTEQPSNDKPK